MSKCPDESIINYFDKLLCSNNLICRLFRRNKVIVVVNTNLVITSNYVQKQLNSYVYFPELTIVKAFTVRNNITIRLS